jgi:hypothetical protein
LEVVKLNLSNLDAFMTGSYWYVEEAFLKALALSPFELSPRRFVDQTVWVIEGYKNGYFWGKTVALNYPAGTAAEERGEPEERVLFGTVTPMGEIEVDFLIKSPFGASFFRTAYGSMEYVAGDVSEAKSYRFLYIVSSGVTDRAQHWHYMNAVEDGDAAWTSLPGTDGMSVTMFLENAVDDEFPFPTVAPTAAPTIYPETDFSFIGGTYWYCATPYVPSFTFDVITEHVEFEFDQTVWEFFGYEDGYFWGGVAALIWTLDQEEIVPDATRALGSVTPDGTVKLSFMPFMAIGAAILTVGTGNMVEYNGRRAFEMQMDTGSTDLLAHWAYMDVIVDTMADWDYLPAYNDSLPNMFNATGNPITTSTNNVSFPVDAPNWLGNR